MVHSRFYSDTPYSASLSKWVQVFSLWLVAHPNAHLHPDQISFDFSFFVGFVLLLPLQAWHFDRQDYCLVPRIICLCHALAVGSNKGFTTTFVSCNYFPL